MRNFKKCLDLKIVRPLMMAYEHNGSEQEELNVETIDSHESYYDDLKPKKEITQKEFKEAIQILIGKMIQDELAHIIVDLDMFADDISEIENNKDDFLKEHAIMKKFIINKGLWEDFLNDDEFNKYLREDYKGD